MLMGRVEPLFFLHRRGPGAPTPPLRVPTGSVLMRRSCPTVLLWLQPGVSWGYFTFLPWGEGYPIPAFTRFFPQARRLPHPAGSPQRELIFAPEPLSILTL